MQRLDLSYVSSIAARAQTGDSNAFAELYAATCQKEYALAAALLKDNELARDVLLKTFTAALNGISRLGDPSLVITWLNRLNIEACEKIERGNESSALPDIIRINGRMYTRGQLMSLPMTEAQTLLFRYGCDFGIGKIASYMEMKRREVRRYMHSGVKRLEKLSV